MAEEKVKEAKKPITEFSDLDLVNMVNELEGVSWRINHDAADGRIPDGEGVDKSLTELEQKKEEIVEEIKKRTGLQTFEQLKVYIQEKLREQRGLWDKQWAELYQERAAFRISGGGKYACSKEALVTVRTYLPPHGTSGPNQIILARIHGTGKFRTFDDRDITELQKLDAKPSGLSREARSIVKARQQLEKRLRLKSNGRNWADFYQSGSVFSHVGFNDTFETYAHFNLPNIERKESNEVILARAYSAQALVEFTQRDLGGMVSLPMEPRYHKQRGWAGCFVAFDVWSEEKK